MAWSTLIVVLWLACAPLGGFIAAVRGRRVQDGFIVGGVFGPIGLLIALRSSRRGQPDSPAAIAEDWGITAALIVVSLAVAGLFLWVVAVGLTHSCPSGEHPEFALGDYTCEVDR